MLKPFARQLLVPMDEGPALVLLAVEDEVDMVVHQAKGKEDQIRGGERKIDTVHPGDKLGCVAEKNGRRAAVSADMKVPWHASSILQQQGKNSYPFGCKRNG